MSNAIFLYSFNCNFLVFNDQKLPVRFRFSMHIFLDNDRILMLIFSNKSFSL